MDRNQAKEFYPILQAFAEGRVIECRTKPSAVEGTDVPNDWTEMKEIEFWKNTEYRIKPEPTYRPFKDAEECWNEMQKHQPFGWVKDNETQSFFVCKAFGNLLFSIGIEDKPYNYNEVLRDYTFADGTPFGIKVEG
nr:MAG TPA: hypothetical protein [Caudoviricetes sp.]